MQIQSCHYTPATGWVPAPDTSLDSERTLVLVFGAPELADAPEPLTALAAAYSNSVVIGCSTAGEIHGDQLADHGIVAAVVRFDDTRLALASAEVSGPDDSRAAGSSLARALQGPDLRGVLVFSDGLAVNGSELVAGIGEKLGRSVVVTGGLAADGDRFQRTWVLREGAPRSGCVVAVGLSGSHVRIGHGSRGGWDKFGPERRVTRSRGNVLHEIDGRPALELYKHYLGERAAGLPATGLLFPLAVRSDRSSDRVVVRTLLAVDEATQSMTFAGDIHEGSWVQLMRANFDRLIAGAGDAAEQAWVRPGPVAHDVLSIAISCVGRRLVLGERAEEELEAVCESLPPGAHQVGFYSYGEISPHGSGNCDLHNQTMTLTSIHEVGRAA